jgi:lysophospholipase L1-like esterase
MTNSIRFAFVTAAFAALISAPAFAREMRLAFIGDSLAYGTGDEAGKGIAGRIEPELRERGFKSIATTNLGVTGTTSRDLTAALQQAATRKAIASAHAIVLSAGANDVRPTLLGEEPLQSPLVIAEEVLNNLEGVVSEIHRLNPEARILILGAYAPVSHGRAAALLGPLVALWDAALTARFVDDPLVSIVRMSDIVDRPERLSKADSFHPGGEAYQETARRIAELLAAPADR